MKLVKGDHRFLKGKVIVYSHHLRSKPDVIAHYGSTHPDGFKAERIKALSEDSIYKTSDDVLFATKSCFEHLCKTANYQAMFFYFRMYDQRHRVVTYSEFISSTLADYIQEEYIRPLYRAIRRGDKLAALFHSLAFEEFYPEFVKDTVEFLQKGPDQESIHRYAEELSERYFPHKTQSG